MSVITNLVERLRAYAGIADLFSKTQTGHKKNNITDLLNEAADTIEMLSEKPHTSQNYGTWIPFETRPLTAEEKERYPELSYIIEGQIPEDGQRILVTIDYKGREPEVQCDVFFSDEERHLDSDYDIGIEAVAWMPLPEPYKGE